MVKKLAFRVHPREAFNFLSGSFLGLRVAIKTLEGLLLDGADIFFSSNIKDILKRVVSYNVISSS